MTPRELMLAAEGFAMSQGVDITPPPSREESVDMVNKYWRELGLAKPVEAA